MGLPISHRNGGQVFLIFVADPRTVRLSALLTCAAQTQPGSVRDVGDEVRYRHGNTAENLILRSALWRAWGYRCYWCSDPQDLLQVDIDHMIPRSVRGPQLKAIVEDVLNSEIRPRPFNIDAPHNLAPICRRCNGEKTNANFITTPRFMSLLRRAVSLERGVVDAVRKFRKRNAFTESMMTSPAWTKATQMPWKPCRSSVPS